MVDYGLKLFLQPGVHRRSRREIMNPMKSVTITVIDGVCFIGACSSRLGAGRVLGGDHRCDSCTAHNWSLKYTDAEILFLEGCERKYDNKSNRTEKTLNLGREKHL